MKAQSAEMKLLKKRLKLEKERVKHANQDAELEKNCKKAVEEELHRIKLELAQFSNRVGLCSSFVFCNVGDSLLEKNGNENSNRKCMQTEKYPLHLQSGKELLIPPCAATKSYEYCRPSLDCPAPSLPISGTCTESTSGAAVVADNNVKSPLRVKNSDGSTRKRKRPLNAIESIEHMYTEGKTWHAKIAKNISALHGILGHMDKPLKERTTSDCHQHQRKRDSCFKEASVRRCISINRKDERGRKTDGDEDVDFNANENNGGEATHTCKDDLDKSGGKDVEIFKRIWDSDYMRLIDLDSAVEEERYRAAVAMPLSPILPNVESKSNQSNDLDDSMPSKVNCSSQGLPSKEVNFNISAVKTYGDSSEIFRNGEDGKTNTMHVTSACVSQDQYSIASKRVSDSGHNGTNSSCRNDSGSAYGDFLHFAVFPEITDSNSLIKIFHTRTFTSQCCAFSQSDYVVKNVVSALSTDESLSHPRKRSACSSRCS